MKVENDILLGLMNDLKLKLINNTIEVSSLKDNDVVSKNLTNKLIEENKLIENQLSIAMKEYENMKFLVISLKHQLQEYKEIGLFQNNKYSKLIEQRTNENFALIQLCKILNIHVVMLKEDNEILKLQLHTKLNVKVHSKESQCFFQDKYFVINFAFLQIGNLKEDKKISQKYMKIGNEDTLKIDHLMDFHPNNKVKATLKLKFVSKIVLSIQDAKSQNIYVSNNIYFNSTKRIVKFEIPTSYIYESSLDQGDLKIYKKSLHIQTYDYIKILNIQSIASTINTNVIKINFLINYCLLIKTWDPGGLKQ